jgi:hypothetical protein
VKNPFRPLADQRALHQNQQLLRAQQGKAELARTDADRLVCVEAKVSYEAMVMDVLRSLQGAIYSGQELKSDELSWSIGRSLKGTDGANRWHPSLEVSLLYDEVDLRPRGFICTRHNRQTLAELNPESLLNALNQLYPLFEPRGFFSSRRAAKVRFEPLVKEAFDLFHTEALKDLSLAGDAHRWSIGQWLNRSNALAWESTILIRLRFNLRNRPVGFRCTAGRKSAKAGLSAAELVEALRRVSPSSSPGA